jgi:opacity protein-like surface antigen
MRNLCWLSHYFSEKSPDTPENHGQFSTIWHPTHVYIASNLGCHRHISGWRNLLRKIPVRKMLMSKTCAISCITLAISALAHAQFLPSGGNGFVGYSYLHGQTFTLSNPFAATGGTASMSGWEASIEGKYLPWLGAVADLDWHYGGRDTRCFVGSCPPFRVNASRDDLLFGPRVSKPFGKYRPFAQFLLGVAYQSDKGGGISNSDTAFARAFGAGVDYTLVRSLALRGQIDVIHTSFFGGGQNNVRFSTGIVFRF